MINAESIFFLVLCFLLNPSLFKRWENFGHDLPCVCQLFLLPLVYGTVPLIELQVSLGLVSQGTLHSSGLCHHPSCSRFVSCLQLNSCSKPTSQSSSLLSMQHCTTCSLKVKVSIPIQHTWTVNFFACSGCFYSPSSAGSAEPHLHSAASEHLSWDPELNSTSLHTISSHPPPPNPYTPTAIPPFGLQTAHCSQGTDKTACQEAAHLPCSV